MRTNRLLAIARRERCKHGRLPIGDCARVARRAVARVLCVGRRKRARDDRLEPVADPSARAGFAGRVEANGLERHAEAVRDIGSRVDERAVEVEGEQLEF